MAMGRTAQRDVARLRRDAAHGHPEAAQERDPAIARGVVGRTWALSVAALALGLINLPALFTASLLILLPIVVSLVLVWRSCVETRERDLRDLEGSREH